ncbi:MAG TPA: hypothetical protein VKR53_01760 [Puia sp.]|nr:hypothetical protein [Puia sp.]
MGKLLLQLPIIILLAGCNTHTDSGTSTAAADTLSYPYKATYSSDITVPGNPANAQKVLQVWKMFESGRIQDMKPFFADSVKYDDASGMHFYGPTAQLLNFAKSDIDNLDSMRFDIIAWQSAHVNDKNEDWVNIWSTERRYPKNGGKADTILMQENWKVKDGKVIAFNQFTAKN